jgi:hypothetical protein
VGSTVRHNRRRGSGRRLVTVQIVPVNPAASVRGPSHVGKSGKTPVLDATS